MAYIYNAGIYCDACGEDIMRRIKAEGNAPDNPQDTRSYDSSEYPKPCDDDETCDHPQHCGSGEHCLEAHVWSDGSKAGKFFENSLTNEGERYVLQMHEEDPNEVTQFWMNYYFPRLSLDDQNDND
jgi:hypothetical protein